MRRLVILDRRRLEQGFSRGEMLGEDKRTMRRSSSHQSLCYSATPHPPTMPSTHFISVHSTLCNISRDISGKFSCAWNSKEKYPQPEKIVRRAREGYDSNEETFADLYLDDLCQGHSVPYSTSWLAASRSIIN